MDVLTVTVAALFLYGKREKFYGIIGFFALLMPFRRATVMAVLLLAVLTWCVRRGRFKPLIVAMALAVSVYASSQILFLGLLRRDFDKREAYRAMGSALPEVRDLGWIIQLNHGHQWWGASYVQPLLPLPSFVIPWAQEHSLRTVSTALIGLDKESTGGLRLTLAGEAYLNFGFLGVLPICFLWGLGMRWIDSAAASVRTDSPFQSYAVSLLLSWLAFWIYLAGTQAGGIIKGGIIISAAVVYVCRNPRTARSVSPMASIPSATGPIQSEG